MDIDKQKEILNWFMGRAGDFIPNPHYQVLLLEMDNIICDREFHNISEVISYVQDMPE